MTQVSTDRAASTGARLARPSIGAVGSFLLHGGSAIMNVIAGVWLIKYLWGWKLLSFMPTIGTGPKAEGGSTKWVLYTALVVISAGILNLAFADFRNRPTAWTHIVTSGFLLGVTVVALLDYHVRAAGLQLSDVQTHVMYSFFWVGALLVLTGLVALRLNRLYFGDIAGRDR